LRRKYTLRFDETKARWVLLQDGTGRIVRVFETKERATRAGVLRKALGRDGGIVTVRTIAGVFDEERVFPSRAPR
jgi:hypothetical protein